MDTNGGFLVTKVKQLSDRVFEKILNEKKIEAFNGAQGRILYVLWQKDGISIKTLSEQCGLAITSLTSMLERMEKQGLLRRENDEKDRRKTLLFLADNPDFDTMTPSYKSGVSLLQKRGQTGRAWGQILNYVNLMGSKQIPQALVLRDSCYSLLSSRLF